MTTQIINCTSNYLTSIDYAFAADKKGRCGLTNWQSMTFQAPDDNTLTVNHYHSGLVEIAAAGSEKWQDYWKKQPLRYHTLTDPLYLPMLIDDLNSRIHNYRNKEATAS